MTTSTLQRQKFALPQTHAVTPPEIAVEETAARHGFTTPMLEKNGAEDKTIDLEAGRRRRPKTGRDFPFAVRLRADTRAAIYERANLYNIPVAQVIEEAIEALKGQGRG